jgi:hypothetical protein
VKCVKIINFKNIKFINAITKIQIIEALGETTTALSKRKKELINELFDVQQTAEKAIIELSSHNLIDISDWGVGFCKGKYNSYMTYNGHVIDKFGGKYDGGDFNSWIPTPDYNSLIEFVEKCPEIVKDMQEALSEVLDKVSSITKKAGK